MKTTFSFLTLSAVLAFALPAQTPQPPKQQAATSSIALWPTDEQQTQGIITILPFSDEKSFGVGVQINGPTEAQWAVVRIFYHTYLAGMSDPILLSKTSVVPLNEGMPVAAEAVNVPKERIVKVEVSLVKTIEAQTFTLPK